VCDLLYEPTKTVGFPSAEMRNVSSAEMHKKAVLYLPYSPPGKPWRTMNKYAGQHTHTVAVTVFVPKANRFYTAHTHTLTHTHTHTHTQCTHTHTHTHTLTLFLHPSLCALFRQRSFLNDNDNDTEHQNAKHQTKESIGGFRSGRNWKPE